MKNIIFLFLAQFLIFVIASCGIIKQDSYVKPDIKQFVNNIDKFYIEYKPDTVAIYVGDNVDSKYYFKNGQWYDCNEYYGKEPLLKMTHKDTICYFKERYDWGSKYKMVFKKINNNEYVCETYDVTLMDCAKKYNSSYVSGAFLKSIVYYDNNYRITKIIVNTLDEYVINSHFED